MSDIVHLILITLYLDHFVPETILSEQIPQKMQLGMIWLFEMLRFGLNDRSFDFVSFF